MIRDNKSCIIEFAGLSGVGKSFIKNKLMCRLKHENFILNKESLKIYDLFNIRSLRMIIYSVFFVLYTKPKTLSCFFDSYKQWLKIQLLYSKIRAKGGNLIVCEGMFHKIRALRRNSKYKFMVSEIKSKYLNNIHFPDIVVLVISNPQDIEKRRRKRENINFSIDLKIKDKMTGVDVTRNDIAAINNVKAIEYNNSNDIPPDIEKENLEDLNNLILGEMVPDAKLSYN